MLFNWNINEENENVFEYSLVYFNAFIFSSGSLISSGLALFGASNIISISVPHNILCNSIWLSSIILHISGHIMVIQF